MLRDAAISLLDRSSAMKRTICFSRSVKVLVATFTSSKDRFAIGEPFTPSPSRHVAVCALISLFPKHFRNQRPYSDIIIDDKDHKITRIEVLHPQLLCYFENSRIADTESELGSA